MNIFELLTRGTLPNEFSVSIGELVRKAREERGLSQDQLSKAIYKRRASISEIENGKMMMDMETLFMLCIALKKPMRYFVPEKYQHYLTKEKLSVREEQLLLEFRRIRDDKQEQLAIKQIQAIADVEDAMEIQAEDLISDQEAS
jgi:transcriptional regulator with XRE-family HTH domain